MAQQGSAKHVHEQQQGLWNRSGDLKGQRTSLGQCRTNLQQPSSNSKHTAAKQRQQEFCYRGSVEGFRAQETFVGDSRDLSG